MKGCLHLTLGSILLCGLAGCGEQGESAIPVEGKIIYNGQPLTVGTVIFTPDAAKGNTSMNEPRGKLDENGTYRLHLRKDREGAPPGWYKISVSAQKLRDSKDIYSYASVIPAKYANPQTSGVAVQVVENAAPGAYDIALTGK